MPLKTLHGAKLLLTVAKSIAVGSEVSPLSATVMVIAPAPSDTLGFAGETKTMGSGVAMKLAVWFTSTLLKVAFEGVY